MVDAHGLSRSRVEEVQGAAEASPAGRGSIGIFDSGVGGLSIWSHIVELLPSEDTIYFADQIHCPYGARSMDEIRRLSEAIVAFLIEQGADLIVVACNTASAAALYHLRRTFPVPVVGMEPALKPAVERSASGRVGVMATPATFEGEPFARLMDRFGQDAVVLRRVCPGLVSEIEAGRIEGPEVQAALESCLRPMLDEGIDVLALGCTHYPFVRKEIEKLVGPRVQVIDPAPAVARQVSRVREGQGKAAHSPAPRQHLFYTSGDCSAFSAMLARLLGREGEVRRARWSFPGTVVIDISGAAEAHLESGAPYPKSDLG